MTVAVPKLVTGVPICIASVHLGYWLLWASSLALCVTLVVLLWTRWGHSRPLHKCAALSLIAHLILAFLMMTVRIVNGDGAGGGGGGVPIHVRIVEEVTKPAARSVISATNAKTDLQPPLLLTPPPLHADASKPVAKNDKVTTKTDAKSSVDIAANDSAKQMVQPKAVEKPEPSAKNPDVAAAQSKPKAPDPPPGVAKNSPPPPGNGDAKVPAPTPVDASPSSASTEEILAAASSNPYALRNAPGRLGLVAGQGGSAETEAAVAAALRWLAAVQARDGRWDAMQFGAGQEQLVLGQNRGGAGQGADTGITALALLAYLGAGHSHLQGAYRDDVRRGLDFLLHSQAADGSLFGNATLYAQMYCHSMATFALAEAEAVTGDRRLAAAVTRAVNFSLAAQDVSTGGWRYRPGDTGDTSQLGWQIMALTSAERTRIQIPDQTWGRVERFLQTVRRGNSGGLASYRPDSPLSTSMTAEALYCRLVLHETTAANVSEPAAEEATSQLLASLPNAERMNLYYWYYATLALHHRQFASEGAATAWRTWNEALKATLTKTQVASGDDAGSWSPSTLWGGYGGRVYTTAMASMCLEVYYRYAPAPAGSGIWMATRPESQQLSR